MKHCLTWGRGNWDPNPVVLRWVGGVLGSTENIPQMGGFQRCQIHAFLVPTKFASSWDVSRLYWHHPPMNHSVGQASHWHKLSINRITSRTIQMNLPQTLHWISSVMGHVTTVFLGKEHAIYFLLAHAKNKCHTKKRHHWITGWENSFLDRISVILIISLSIHCTWKHSIPGFPQHVATIHEPMFSPLHRSACLFLKPQCDGSIHHVASLFQVHQHIWLNWWRIPKPMGFNMIQLDLPT